MTTTPTDPTCRIAVVIPAFRVKRDAVQASNLAPNLLQLPSGCAFAPRCAQASAACAAPQVMRDMAGRQVRCVQAGAQP